MPYLAQREDLPDSHKLWADPGSEHERVLRALGYVDVPAPGASVSEQTDEPETFVPLDPASPRSKDIVDEVHERMRPKRGKS